MCIYRASSNSQQTINAFTEADCGRNFGYDLNILGRIFYRVSEELVYNKTIKLNWVPK